jgi:hypothetical protein
MDDDNIKPITNQGFFTYVFKLSKFKQEDLMNITQYTFLSIVPVMLFIYFTKKYFPLVHEDDSSIYILTVTILQLIFMIIGIFFIDRIINYIPTYSGKYYETINLTTVVLIFILFMLLVSGGFRLRTATLLKRFDDWFTIDNIIARKLGIIPKPFDIYMEDTITIKKREKGSNKASTGVINASAYVPAGGQQMSQQYATPPPLPTQGPVMPNPMSNYGGTMPTQQVQNFNSMYTNPAASMNGGGGGGGGGGMGGDESFMEPMAANSVLCEGCGAWSKW